MINRIQSPNALNQFTMKDMKNMKLFDEQESDSNC